MLGAGGGWDGSLGAAAAGEGSEEEGGQTPGEQAGLEEAQVEVQGSRAQDAQGILNRVCCRRYSLD